MSVTTGPYCVNTLTEGIEQERWQGREGEEGEVGDMEEGRTGRRDMRETETGKGRQGWEKVPYWDV